MASSRLLPADDEDDDEDEAYVPLRLLHPLERRPWALATRAAAQIYLGLQLPPYYAGEELRLVAPPAPCPVAGTKVVVMPVAGFETSQLRSPAWQGAAEADLGKEGAERAKAASGYRSLGDIVALFGNAYVLDAPRTGQVQATRPLALRAVKRATVTPRAARVDRGFEKMPAETRPVSAHLVVPKAPTRVAGPASLAVPAPVPVAPPVAQPKKRSWADMHLRKAPSQTEPESEEQTPAAKKARQSFLAFVPTTKKN